MKVVSTCEDGFLRFIDLDSNKITQIEAHQKRAVGIASSSDGALIASASFDKTIKFFDRHGSQKGSLELADEALGIAFSNDDSRLYVTTKTGQLFIYSVIKRDAT